MKRWRDDGAERGLPSSVALKPFQCGEGTIPSAVGGGEKKKNTISRITEGRRVSVKGRLITSRTGKTAALLKLCVNRVASHTQRTERFCNELLKFTKVGKKEKNNGDRAK